MGKTVTAYFAFSADHRAGVRKELEDAAEPGEKISVASVAKGLGQKWKQLDDAEKERYKAIAKERTAAAAEQEAAAAAEREQAAAAKRDEDQPAAAAAACGGSPTASGAADDEAADAPEADAQPPADTAADDDAAATAEGHTRPASLPVSIVKRIMCFDDDVDRVAAGAVRAAGKAAELFLGLLAEKGMAVAAKGKRKTLKFSDIQQVARRDKRLIEMGLRDIFDNEETFAEARGEGKDKEDAGGEKENEQQRPAKKTKLEEAAQNAKPITSFFKATAA